MIRHDDALALAAAALDFGLSPAERAELDAHLAACPACTADARAMRSDLSALSAVPVAPLDRRRADDLLATALEPERSVIGPLRLLLVAALIALLALGSIVVGSILLEHRRPDVSIVVPAPSPAASAAIADPTPAPSPSRDPAMPVGLVVREFSCDVCAPGIGTVVLDDGRVLWQSSAGLRVRWLDQLGLDQVRSGLAIPALATSADYQPTVRAGASPPAFGPENHRFQLERDGARVEVKAGDAPSYALWPGAFDIPDQAVALSALADSMHDPEAWIGADRWASDAQPYAPERYLVIVSHAGEGMNEPRIDTAAVAWPFGSIETIGATYRPGANTPIESGSRCLAVTAETARAMAAAEAAAGASRELGAYQSEWTYASSVGSTTVVTRALLPYQSSDCTEAMAW